MVLKTEALVIKEQTVGETDKLLTLLTADEGVIKAFARRAKSLKDNKSSATGLLSYSSLSIYKGRDKYIVDEAMPIEIFFGLRSNIENLALAQYFCELSALLIPEAVDSKEYLRLVLNSISFLAKNKKEPLQIKAITELRMLSLAGYMPNLVACKECACYENDIWYFTPTTGEIFCSDCLPNGAKNAIKLNQSILNAMRHIIYVDFKRVYSFEMPKDAIIALAKICEEYTLNTIGKIPMTLDFFKTMSGF